MSWMNHDRKLALALALTLLGSAACNTQKAEQTESEDATAETATEGAPNRDNRSSQSGDAAFIKIFPDGDSVVARGETATVSAPAATSTAHPAESSATSGSSDSASTQNQTSAHSETPSSTETSTSQSSDSSSSQASDTSSTQTTDSSSETAQSSDSSPTQSSSTASTPSSDTSSTQAADPAASQPTASQTASTQATAEETPAIKDQDDSSRPVLTLNESTASTIISVLPKENKSIVAIGKHANFAAGAYMIMAKWNNDSKKVKVNVTSIEAKEKNCAIDENASQGEWKTLGVFYLTKNAKVVITNAKNSSYSVKNELLLKPVIAENLTSPSKFRCLDGQIDGQGLIAFP